MKQARPLLNDPIVVLDRQHDVHHCSERDILADLGKRRRLVIVSNRIADPQQGERAGGLAVALGDAFRVQRGLWLGWSGEVNDDAAEREPEHRASGNVDLVTLDLTREEYEACYLGYANRCLWPILHYRADLLDYRRNYLETYKDVNRRFAEVLGPLLREDDLVWVHDYHLIPLAECLRERGYRQPIGFFLHVPFPPPEVLSALPGYDMVLRGLAAYDLVGFQTEADTRCFRDCLVRLAGGRAKARDSVEAHGHNVRAGAFPVGSDIDGIAELAADPRARSRAAGLVGALQDRDLIIGVDRLDYTKGLAQRFGAYRRLLERFPERRNRVSLLQIAPLSRQEVDAYADTRSELDRLSGEINGMFAELDWTPIRYHVKALDRARLAALFRTARVGLVTPLRDGMNLVAKEYVAAQDPEDPGVLVLSRFAGAAETMAEALIVNPYDADATAEAMDRALSMPLEERRARHAALLKRLREQDVHAWRRSFLASLAAVGTAPSRAPQVEEDEEEPIAEPLVAQDMWPSRPVIETNPISGGGQRGM